MTEIKEIAFRYIAENPILIPFAVFAFFYLKNSNFRKSTNKFVFKLFLIASNKPILAHDLFYQENLFRAQIKRVSFKSKEKTEMFRILLNEKIKAVIEIPKQRIKEKAKFYRSAHPDEITAELYGIVESIIEQYEKKIREQYQCLYGARLGNAVYNLVYLGEKGFKQYHDNNVEFIEKNIRRLSRTASKNINDIFRTFLFQLLVATDTAILDCEDAFNGLNGDLEEVIREIRNYRNEKS
jgi:hypothetical protein